MALFAAKRPYKPAKVWSPPANVGGKFGGLNRPTAGPRQEKELERGKHPIQLYSMGTPNGVKVTILLEELVERMPGFEYDAWLTKIDGAQFDSGFVAVNPNSKIPCMLHYTGATWNQPTRVFESGAIMLYLCEQFDKDHVFLPTEPRLRAECLSWLMFQMGSGPYVGGGGFGHFYQYAPVKIEYCVNRATMELKRLLDVLDRHLGGKSGGLSSGGPYMCGAQYTIADMALWPWFGALALGRLYGDSATYLDIESYTHVMAWAKRINERPAVQRGRMVNRTWGPTTEQVPNRHSRADFQGKTLPKAPVHGVSKVFGS